MPHTRIWDETLPPNSQAAAQGALRIRDMKVDITERMAIDHYWDVDVNTDGWHKQVTLPELGADPVAAVNHGIVYTKDVAGTTHLFFRANDGTVRQLTGAISNTTIPWASITGIPAFVAFLDGLVDPNVNAFLRWNDSLGDFDFVAAGGISADYGGFVDGSAGAGVTAVFNPAASGWSVSRVGVGRFTVTHNLALAAVTDLAIVANVRLNAGGTDDRYCTITAETANAFDVLVNDVGAGAVDDDFYFHAKRLV